MVEVGALEPRVLEVGAEEPPALEVGAAQLQGHPAVSERERGILRGLNAMRDDGPSDGRTGPPQLIAGISVPTDRVSSSAWIWAWRLLPQYLFRHSVRTYCWGVTIAEREDWRFDRRLLWAASLLHDVGLTRIRRGTACFEVESAESARRIVSGAGMPEPQAHRVATAIVLHMRPSVTQDDGLESVLLHRATAVDVTGSGYDIVARVATRVVEAFPRGRFDELFVAALGREAKLRPQCQSARLLRASDFVARMDASPWRVE